MELKGLGGSGEKIPVLGMGTWDLNVNPELEKEAMIEGIKKGMRFIDTAEMYGTEPMVGEVLRQHGNVFLATKVSPHNFRYVDVIKACNASLERLGVRQIDLYQLHWPNNRVPIGETMQAMEKLVHDGKIRYIGVCNFSMQEFEVAQEAMKKYEIVSNQVEYSVLSRDVEKGLLEYCTKNKITVIAYSPFGKGAFFSPRYSKVVSFLQEIGRKYNKSAPQVALNWLISKPAVVAIPLAGKKEHMIENAGAADWKLDRSDIEKINHFLLV